MELLWPMGKKKISTSQIFRMMTMTRRDSSSTPNALHIALLSPRHSFCLNLYLFIHSFFSHLPSDITRRFAGWSVDFCRYLNDLLSSSLLASFMLSAIITLVYPLLIALVFYSPLILFISPFCPWCFRSSASRRFVSFVWYRLICHGPYLTNLALCDPSILDFIVPAWEAEKWDASTTNEQWR